ncbi:MAG: hypothetical protein K1X72_23975 [Pyrinomonadaceae bacterium]|nr:hypothetical protein [Pyrinomonadaceae bacterium]
MNISKTREILFKFLAPIYLFIICCVPLGICFGLYLSMPNFILQICITLLSPIVYVLCFIFFAGLLCLPHRKYIIAGRFPRKLGNKVYFHRRLYGLCLTTIYYFTPIFFIVLSFSTLKKMLFRLWGYQGSMDFVTYPDTWIRDVALLQIGNGAYLSNKATIGTNIVQHDGTIIVEAIKIGDRSVVGHLTMIGPGVEMGKDVEVNPGCIIGLHTFLDDGVKVKAYSGIDSFTRIGARTIIGSMSYIGPMVTIAPDLVIPAGITIPAKTKITCQEDVAFFAEHIKQAKTHQRNRIRQINQNAA